MLKVNVEITFCLIVSIYPLTGNTFCLIVSICPLTGNGSFWSYSCSDPGLFRSCSLLVRSSLPDFRGGSFWPILGVGRFGPILVGCFGPLYFK